MRRFVPVAALALGLLALWPSPVHPHGGPPVTDDVLLGSGDISLVTSHGFFTEDGGWAWICEEATGAAMAASVVRTPSRWMVGTVTGLRTSTDGCNWSHDPAFGGINILRVMQDVADPERVWLATTEGLWVVDGAEAPILEMPMTFSVRHVGQRQDGALLIVGFDGGQPVAELKGERVDLPAETGRIEILSVDDQGRFYLRFPAGLTDRLVRVSEAGAEVLIAVTDLIKDVAAVGDDLYVLYRDGVSWSADDGATWAPPAGEPLTCLRSRSDGFYACPEVAGGPALYWAPSLAADPAEWKWDPVLNFDEVSKSTCEFGSTAGNLCPYLWHVVSEELGIPTPLPEADPPVVAPANEGCAAATVPGVSWWLLVLLVALLRFGLRVGRRRAILG